MIALEDRGLSFRNSIEPLADLEQGGDGFMHDPKGRRIKLGLMYRFGIGKVDGSGRHPLLPWWWRTGCAAASLTKPYG